MKYRTQKIRLHAQVSGRWSGVYRCLKHTVRRGQSNFIMIPVGKIF